MSENDSSEQSEQQSEQESTSPFGENGTLVKDWHTLAPEGYEELKESQTLPRLKNFWDMAKSYEHVRKQVPLDKIPKPSEKFSEDDWNAFYDAGGRPATPKDYGIKRHEEIPENVMPDEMIEGYEELFHRIGLSKKQVDAIKEHNDNITLTAMKNIIETDNGEAEKVEEALRKDWGRAYEQNVHRGNVAIEKDKDAAKDPAYRQRLLEKVNKDPDLIRFASNMGYKFVEHKIIEEPGIPTPADLQQQITEIMADPRYSSKDPSVRQPLIDKVLMLRRKLNER